MTPQDILLFVSSSSQACKPVVNYISSRHLPIKIIRLDSTDSREAAANGSHFQIHVVPSLVVIGNDGNVQMFTGAPKIMQWLDMVTGNPSQTPESPQGGSSYQEGPPRGGPSRGGYQGPSRGAYQGPSRGGPPRGAYQGSPRGGPSRGRGSPRGRGYPPQPVSRGRSRGLYDGRGEVDYPEDYEEWYPEDEEYAEEYSEGVDIEFLDDEPPSPKSKGKKTKKSSKSKPKRPPPPPTKGLMVGDRASKGPSRMGGIMDIAKQMEQQRKATLGYDEEKLPK